VGNLLANSLLSFAYGCEDRSRRGTHFVMGYSISAETESTFISASYLDIAKSINLVVMK